MQIIQTEAMSDGTIGENGNMIARLPRLCSGIEGLDAILDGGFVQGASYIVQGQPGAGKTIFANQIAFSLAKSGRKALYVTLLAEAHDRLFQSLGTLEFFDSDRLGTDIFYISAFQTLRDKGLSEVVNLLRREIARQDAEILIFDGLLNASHRAESDLDVKTFVAEVQGQAAFVGCTVLFLTSAKLTEGSPEHTMVDGVIELHDESVGVRSVRRLQVRKSRGSAALGGLHQYEITSAGIRTFPRLEAALAYPSLPDVPNTVPVPTGVEGLDPLLGGGFPGASLSLLLGPSGAGKTSFGLSFLGAATAQEPALVFGFYETPERLRLKSASLGISLERLEQTGALEIAWQPMAENLLDKLAYRLLDRVRAQGTKRLLIDSLGGFERAAIYPPRLVEFFATLANELRALGVTTIATSELTTMFASNVSAPLPEISSLLDNLLVLHHVEHSGNIKRALSVLKVRDGVFDPNLHEVVIGREGLKIEATFGPVEGALTGMAPTSGA